jgi:23S rRNA (cytidine1920-2'-O)/16S rRNA (cytidine1409-2'-O)-methyltransferase
VRLDAAVSERTGMTRSQARSLIMEARVRVDGAVSTKAGHPTAVDADIEIERPRKYVSRGGEKLEAALDGFEVDVCGVRALDVGASTGGFTDCLLQRGASSVTAVDVGYGQLDWRLRNDPRVTVVERSNFRLLPEQTFAGGFDTIVVDTSFISLRTILKRAAPELRENGDAVCLVKPQFEAGRDRLGSGGVVRDRAVHRAVLLEIRDAIVDLGLVPVAVMASPLLGPAGNREFFTRVRRNGTPYTDADVDRALQSGEPA